MAAKLLISLFKKYSNSTTADDYVFHKIVDNTQDNQLILHCINTDATFSISVQDIVFDTTILFSLHPIQACYVGIEYAEQEKTNTQLNDTSTSLKSTLRRSLKHRYGRYVFQYKTRSRQVGFIDIITKKEFLMDPRDIALSRELIREFDASQAFYIGVLAGLTIANPVTQQTAPVNKKPFLRLVK